MRTNSLTVLPLVLVVSGCYTFVRTKASWHAEQSATPRDIALDQPSIEIDGASLVLGPGACRERARGTRVDTRVEVWERPRVEPILATFFALGVGAVAGGAVWAGLSARDDQPVEPGIALAIGGASLSGGMGIGAAALGPLDAVTVWLRYYYDPVAPREDGEEWKLRVTDLQIFAVNRRPVEVEVEFGAALWGGHSCQWRSPVASAKLPPLGGSRPRSLEVEGCGPMRWIASRPQASAPGFTWTERPNASK